MIIYGVVLWNPDGTNVKLVKYHKSQEFGF